MDGETASDSPFAVGDKVKVYRPIADGEADWWANDAKWFTGDSLTVKDVLLKEGVSAVSVEENLSTWPTCILRHADPEAKYEPAVGDVVSFRYKGRPERGIIYSNANINGLLISVGCYDKMIFRVANATDIKKAGFASEAVKSTLHSEIDAFTKVYFSEHGEPAS